MPEKYGVWLPIEEAPKDGTLIICCWSGKEGWRVLCWKNNPRISMRPEQAKSERLNGEYFGDCSESDDYELAEYGAGPTHFLLVPPIPKPQN